MTRQSDLFSQQYREHALPELRRRVSFLALQVALEDIEYDEAHDRAINAADKLGRWNLPNDRIADLAHWLMATLTEEVANAWRRCDAINTAHQRELIANPIAHYERLAAGDTRLRWTFAAICPEYRRHLVKEAQALRARTRAPVLADVA
jgi:hypothetical protein